MEYSVVNQVINKKFLQFILCNQGKPYGAREGELFCRGEKEVGRAIVNKEAMALH